MRESIELKAQYTVSELAELAGMSRKAMRRTLVQGGVPIEGRGARVPGRVWVSDLQEHMPKLWESLVSLAAARRSDPGDAGPPWAAV